MNDEAQIRFALPLDRNKPFVDAVLDYVEEIEQTRRKQYELYKKENRRLEDENRKLRDNHFDSHVNALEISRCWGAIGHWNKQHLELHEALTEKLRELKDPTWNHGTFVPVSKETCTCYKSGYESFDCPVHTEL